MFSANVTNLALAAWLMMVPFAWSADSGKGNVILFLIDDLGWRDIGCQGSDYYQTPNIDALAREGVRFTQAYSACAVCSPTRAAILTGKYPARLLLTDWLPAGRWNPKAKLREGRFVRGLPVEEWSLAEAFREAGYRTACIGKWHLGSEPFSLPEHHGFDVNIGGNAHGAPGSFFYPYEGNWLIPSTDIKAKWNVLPDGIEGEYLTDRLTDEAVRFIRENQERPFFLYFPHYGVHTPIQAKPGTATRYEQIPEDRRQGMPEYAAMVQSIDESVGRVMHLLDELRLTEKTTVIFTSDNGGFWKATQNTPLRANKGAYYEGGIRVPLILRLPGVKQRGLVIDTPVISTDLYPTCLSAAGLPQIPNQHLDGLDLGPLIHGDRKTLDRSALYWHYPHYNEHPSSVPSSVIRKGRWKLIEAFDPEGLELYDLEQDVGEENNLALKQPEQTAELHRELIAWRNSIDAEMMRPNPNYDPASKPVRKKKSRDDER
jgi:arylsulfatase A